ncbi:MAG: tyrosine-type recombinase/integrase [Opitutaceae bacterium]|jgi:site-specific recombinase XerD
MKPKTATDLARSIYLFFQDYLPVQRGTSLHTIRSYRDTMLLLLRHMARDGGSRIETLKVSDFTSDRVLRFLRHLEHERHNAIATRNVRLAAIHTFARFLIGYHPEHMATLQGVLAIPFKRGTKKAPIDYLDSSEVEALLKSINQSSPSGRRDYALFALMFNTGARVQEALNLKVQDVRFVPPHQVRFIGKGNTERVCPIWPRTAKLLQELAADRIGPDPAEVRLFLNRHGEPLTRYGVRYLLRKYLPCRLGGGGSGAGKAIHPHSLRHTTAVFLLKAGVDFAMISQWLGHANLATTMRYARADMDLKRQALAQVFPDTLGAPAAGRVRLDGSEFSRWLRRL